jgi:hypothetical protein
VGAPVHKTVPLWNVGKTDAVFTASAGDAASVLRCTPSVGRISPGGSLDLELTFEADEAKAYDAWLQVRGIYFCSGMRYVFGWVL